jgi:hypothetical protein
MAWCQSKYAGPFENYRRNRDPAAFGKEMQKAEELGIDLRDEVPFLLGVIASSGDKLIREEARLSLFTLAWGQVLNDHPSVKEVFRPAVAVFEAHLDEALIDESFGWGSSIASLTAFIGLQPDERSLALFYRMLDYKDKRAHGIALTALARLKPLPSAAKRLLLSRTGNYPLRERLEVLAFAIEDSDVLQTYARYLESNDIEEGRLATRMLSRIGPQAKPALELLQRLQQRSDLDEEVAANVKAAIDHIQKETPRQDR